MKKLKIYWRCYQRQAQDYRDYFRDIREKYGSEFSYSETDTTYMAVSHCELPKLRDRGIMVASIDNGYAVVIQELVGEISVQSEQEALDMSSNCDDHVLAEYVYTFPQDRGPE